MRVQETTGKESVGFRLLTFFFFLVCLGFLCFQALDLSSVYKMFPLFNVLRLLDFIIIIFKLLCHLTHQPSAYTLPSFSSPPLQEHLYRTKACF